MLRTRNDLSTLWDAIIPPQLFELFEQLAKVDRILDDKRFFAAFGRTFTPPGVVPSIALETHLLLILFKYR